ncbi:GNAT family N-acetyltransferase, partial [Escherichia coli]|nr:GNAT family N-acetyltransferase [Escherichia coli]
MEIRVDDLSGNQVKALIAEHLAGMFADSPPESVHALDLEGLKRPEVTFWCAWEGQELMGCGAMKELDSEHGELKSMRTASA